MTATRHVLIDEYLRTLRGAMNDVPSDRREDIVAEIEEHIAGRLAEFPATPSEADIRRSCAVLDRKLSDGGTPEHARPLSPRRRAGWP